MLGLNDEPINEMTLGIDIIIEGNDKEVTVILGMLQIRTDNSVHIMVCIMMKTE